MAVQLQIKPYCKEDANIAELQLKGDEISFWINTTAFFEDLNAAEFKRGEKDQREKIEEGIGGKDNGEEKEEIWGNDVDGDNTRIAADQKYPSCKDQIIP